MRLAALCVYGSLLAFSSLPIIPASPGEAAVRWSTGPCSAALRPAGPCGVGEDGDTCPYRVLLPPLTIHLPKQLRELGKLVREVQRLKDNVDQLRRTCTGCASNQEERHGGRPRGGEVGGENVGEEMHQPERSRVTDGDPERRNESRKEVRDGSGTLGAAAVMESDLEGKTVSDGESGQKGETDQQGDKLSTEGNESRRDTDTEGNEDASRGEMEDTKGQNRRWEAQVNAGVETGQTRDKGRGEAAAEKESRGKGRLKHPEGGRRRDTENEDGSEMLNGDSIRERMEKEEVSSPWWEENEEKKEMESRTRHEEERGSEKTKAVDTRSHTDTEHHGKKRTGETGTSRIMRRKDDNMKQTGSSGNTEEISSVKNGEEEREETLQSTQRGSDGDLVSSKPREMADVASHSVSPLSTLSSAGLRKTTGFTSSAPSGTGSQFIRGHLRPSPTQISTSSGTSSNFVYDFTFISSMSSSPKSNTGPVQKAGLALPSPASISTDASPPPDKQMTTSARPETPTSGASTASRPSRPSQRVKSHSAHHRSDQSDTGASTMGTVTHRSGTELQRSDPLSANPGSETAFRTPAWAGTTATTTSRLTISDGQITSPGARTSPTTSSLRPGASSLGSFRSTTAAETTTKPGKMTPANGSSRTQTRGRWITTMKTRSKVKQARNPALGRELKPEDKSKLGLGPTDKIPNSDLALKKNSSDRRPNSSKDPVRDQKPTSGYDSNPSARPETTNPHKTTKLNQRLTSDQNAKPYRMSSSHRDYTPDPKPEPQRGPTSSLPQRSEQKPTAELRSNSDRGPSPETEAKPHSVPDSKPERDPSYAPTLQKHKHAKKMPKTDQRPGPHRRTIKNLKLKPEPMLITDPQHGPMSNFNKNDTPAKPVNDQKIESDVRTQPDQDPSSDRSLRTTTPDQIPQPSLESLPDPNPDQVPPKKPNPRLAPRLWSLKRPRQHQRATPLLKPRPKVKPKKSPQTTSFDFSPSVATDGPRKNHAEMPFTPSPAKGTSELDLSQEDRERMSGMVNTVSLSTKTSKRPFLEVSLPHHRHADFTSGSNSWITSHSKTTTQPSINPKTTIPSTRSKNNIYHNTIPSNSPGTIPTKPSVHLVPDREPGLKSTVSQILQDTAPDPGTEAKEVTFRYSQIPSNNPQTMSTFNSRLNSDLSTSTPAPSNPEPSATDPVPDLSTPGPRELRVKINQVAAFLDDNLGKSRRPQDKRLETHPKGKAVSYQESSRANGTESQLPSPDVTMARDCSDHIIRSMKRNGIYQVTPDPQNRTFLALCDMETHGGGWTLIQHRKDGSVSFNRTWAEYRMGFGHLNGGEFWLGNDNIHLLTRTRDMILRVELEDFGGVKEHAEYGQFRVASEHMRYRLTVGSYSGTAGDALRFSKSYDHNNKAFTTPDKDHDHYPSGNCGAYYSSGWWFDACMAANLNGKYYVGTYKGVRNGIFWGTWHNMSTDNYPTSDRLSFKTVKMMIRPKGFEP